MFEEFKQRYLGKTVDIDGQYGGQCVDLFNAWNRDYNGCYINCSPSGYAHSLAENKANNGILNYFNETTVDNMIEGTVVVYGECAFAPVGHVCFFIKDNGDGTYQALQQNHKGRQYVTIDNNTYNGIIGAFIPKQVQKEFDEKHKPAPEPTPEPVVKELNIGTRVKAIGEGNGSSYGDSNVAWVGNEGTITRIIEDRPYPYLISDEEGPLGWYKAEDLEII